MMICSGKALGLLNIDPDPSSMHTVGLSVCIIDTLIVLGLVYIVCYDQSCCHLGILVPQMCW